MVIQLFIWRVGAVLRGNKGDCGWGEMAPGFPMRALTSFRCLEVSRDAYEIPGCFSRARLIVRLSLLERFHTAMNRRPVLGWEFSEVGSCPHPSPPRQCLPGYLRSEAFSKGHSVFQASASFRAWKYLSPSAVTGTLRVLFPGPQEIPLRGAGKPPNAFLSGSSRGADGSNMSCIIKAPSFCLERRQQRGSEQMPSTGAGTRSCLWPLISGKTEPALDLGCLGIEGSPFQAEG